MTGEYPVAVLNYRDPEIPVQAELTAFTPFAPLDSDFSSWPVASFTFRLHNPTAAAQTVSIGAFLQNPIGYDALGPASRNTSDLNGRHPNFGGNYNQLHQEKASAVLSLRAKPAQRPTLDQPIRLYTNGNVAGLNRLPFERPENLTIFSLEAISTSGATDIIWVENPSLELNEAALRKVRDAVREGATLIWSGTEAPLLAVSTEQGNTAPAGSDVLFEDFEQGYENWTVTGTAFGTSPAPGTLPNQQALSGFADKGLVNSFLGGDDATGRMTSRTFRVERRYIRFLIGGGDHPRTQIRLMVDGKAVRTQSGTRNERLAPAVWDVQEWNGKNAQLVIVDEQKGPWGHINIDQIEFADQPFPPAVMELVRELRPGDKEEDAIGSGLRFTRRAFGKGTILRVPISLMNNEDSELWGVRQQALATLCQLAGAAYRVPEGVPALAPGMGSMALAAAGPTISALETFTDWGAAWRWFSGNDVGVKSVISEPTAAGQTVNGALSATIEVAPGATIEVPFVLSWHYPNHYNAANQPMGNHYARRWKDAPAVAREALRRTRDFQERTATFRKHFYDSTLPYWLLDAVTSQISTIRHAGVVFRIGNGDFYGWEGSNGCCPPTCTHVWGYEQSLAYLFPDLERDMRRIDLFRQQNADGGVNNRTAVPSPPQPSGEHPFSDGHASTILKAYREARNHPDETLFRSYWPNVKAAVDYLIAQDAASSPDRKPDGTLSGDQWNTYDNAIHGVNTFIGSYYLAALRAGEEMARRVGAGADGDRFRDVFVSGQKRLVELCWNGEYFQQHLPDYLTRAGEYGPGCLSDQLIGQWWAHQLELGYILPQKMVRTALASISRYNFLADHTQFRHNWRKFAGGTDKGLLNCTWPKGGRPEATIPYVDEVWTGVEYQVAAHMLYEGMTDDAFAIVKAARDRYDGAPRAPMPRNPWSEVECGGHYARAMSSWSLLLALSGFAYDGPRADLRFMPRHQSENFKSFFSGPAGWGTVRQIRLPMQPQRNEITVAEGTFSIHHLRLDPGAAAIRNVQITLAGKPQKASWERSAEGEISVRLDPKVTIKTGKTLSVELISGNAT